MYSPAATVKIARHRFRFKRLGGGPPGKSGTNVPTIRTGTRGREIWKHYSVVRVRSRLSDAGRLDTAGVESSAQVVSDTLRVKINNRGKPRESKPLRDAEICGLRAVRFDMKTGLLRVAADRCARKNERLDTAKRRTGAVGRTICVYLTVTFAMSEYAARTFTVTCNRPNRTYFATRLSRITSKRVRLAGHFFERTRKTSC